MECSRLKVKPYFVFEKAEASAPVPISVTVNAAAVIKAPIFLIFLRSVHPPIDFLFDL